MKKVMVWGKVVKKKVPVYVSLGGLGALAEMLRRGRAYSKLPGAHKATPTLPPQEAPPAPTGTPEAEVTPQSPEPWDAAKWNIRTTVNYTRVRREVLL